MLTVGVALASLLSFTSPPEGNGDAPVIVVAPAAAPTVAPAVAPPPPPPTIPKWGPQADVVVSESSPGQPIILPQRIAAPRKPMMGIGLFISSAVAFGVGIGSRVGQVDVAVARCRTWRSSTFHFTSRTRCFDFYDSPGVDRDDLAIGVAYGSSIVLANIGAGALGQRQAWESAYGDMRARRPMSRYVMGAIFTGLGIASIGAHFALIQANAKNPCTSWECNVERRALWIAASDGGALLLNTGLSLFSWAGNYRKNLERYEGMQWGVIPSVAPGSVGATASMRF